MNKKAVRAVEERLMHSLIPFLILGLAAAPAFAKAPRPDASGSREKIPTVLVLGDSLSAGYGVRRGDAYPALLSAKAEASGHRLHLINASVSGDTTAGGLRRLGPLLDQRIDLILIELGINDAFRGVPVAQIEANLQKIIDQTRGRHPQVRVVIAGMQLPNHSGTDYLSAFGEMYSNLAERNHAELIPFLLEGVAGNPAFNQSDLIHPNASGQKILAANVWPVLEMALQKRKQI